MIFEMQVITFFNYFEIQNAVSLKLIKYKLWNIKVQTSKIPLIKLEISRKLYFFQTNIYTLHFNNFYLFKNLISLFNIGSDIW